MEDKWTISEELLSNVGDKIQGELLKIENGFHVSYECFCFLSGHLASNKALSNILLNLPLNSFCSGGDLELLSLRKREFKEIQKNNKSSLNLLKNLQNYLSILLKRCVCKTDVEVADWKSLPKNSLVTPSYLLTITNMINSFENMVQRVEQLFHCVILLFEKEIGKHCKILPKFFFKEPLDIVRFFYSEKIDISIFSIYTEQMSFQETLLLLDHLRTLKRDFHLRWLQNTKYLEEKQ